MKFVILSFIYFFVSLGLLGIHMSLLDLGTHKLPLMGWKSGVEMMS